MSEERGSSDEESAAVGAVLGAAARWGEAVCLQQLAHPAEVSCTALGEGGRVLATGAGRELRLWRWSDGGGAGWQAAGREKRAHRHAVTACCWSRAARWLASGGVDGAVRLWSGALCGRDSLAAGGAAAVRALCWAGGGGRLLVGHDDGALCVWRAPPGARLLARVPAHEGALYALAVTGRLLLSACTEGVLKLYDVEELISWWSDCEGEGEGSTRGTVRPLGWVDGAHDLGATCAAVGGAGRVATGGRDGRVALWAVGAAGVRRTGLLEAGGGGVTALDWAGALLAAVCMDGGARLWAGSRMLRVLPAHRRYATCLQLLPGAGPHHDATLLFTGSNDRSLCVWALGEVALEDEPPPRCRLEMHFGLGDLEGIGPVDMDAPLSGDFERGQTGASGGSARLLCQLEAGAPHGGSINSVSAVDGLVATACSDGGTRVFRFEWRSEEGCELGALVPQWEGPRHWYPARAAQLAWRGALLLTVPHQEPPALWDLQSGCLLRTLSTSELQEEIADSGEGGALRCAALTGSGEGNELLLVGTEAGRAAVWPLAAAEPAPSHVYSGVEGGVWSCAWAAASEDGRRLAALGGGGGELRLVTSPPASASDADTATLHRQLDAHDLGVYSCEWATQGTAAASLGARWLLASGGGDGHVKVWAISADQELSVCAVRLARRMRAHCGSVHAVHWLRGLGTHPVLASGGADRWLRLWSVRSAACMRALPAPGGETTAVGSMRCEGGALLVAGAIDGALSVWRLEEQADDEADADGELGGEPRCWPPAHVQRWLRDYVTSAPEVPALASGLAARVSERAAAGGLSGARLLDVPEAELVAALGLVPHDEDDMEPEVVAAEAAFREHVLTEIRWLRQDPVPLHVELQAPHELLCPLSHRVMLLPTRAADGLTYCQLSLHEWLVDTDGESVEQRAAFARLAPNRRMLARLRRYLSSVQLSPHRADSTTATTSVHSSPRRPDSANSNTSEMTQRSTMQLIP